MSSSSLSRRRFLAVSMAGLALSACGGSSGSSSSSGPVDSPLPPDPQPEPIPDSAEPGPIPPRGLHLSFVGDSHTSRTVTWFTDGLEPPQSRLEFGVVEEGMSEADIAEQVFEHFVDASADETPGVESFTHRATAGGIDAEKPMRYRVGSDEGGWSPVYVVAPSPRDEWSFIHFGDHGIGDLPQQLTAEVLKTPADLIMIAGDLSYANGDQPIWDTWFEQMEPLLARRITMTAPGNHEQKDFGGEAFKNRFTHPPKPLSSVIGQGSPGSSFYSFDYNRVHFLVTTAGALINDGTLVEEIINIEVDLAQAALRRARGEIDFIVVMQHYTIWTDQLGRSPANPTLVALEENIMLRYGVDLLAVGHDHVYQRSKPMGLGLPNPLGYVQVLVGTGGASIRLFDENGPQIWSAAEFIGVGFCRYAVSPGKIRGEYYGSPPLDLSDEGRQYITGDFSLQDSFEISAKPQIACQLCAKPARSSDILLADYEAISRHTRERNRHDLRHC
ncbi:purple acid phosphatase family protein [Spongiibacter sp. UBA1325]|uniref:purple acid phosphatase family protein n=1 Tax=Spongiibacter sp. UBA1325 TaxID=1947543 RepID=UPI00257CB7C0|nr:metallophosphoesterase family protein [Spongiibacter sp. UBA1325]